MHGCARPAVLEPLCCVSHLGCGCLLVAHLVWQVAQLRSLPFVCISTLLFSVGMVLLLAVAVMVTMVLVTVVLEVAW